MNQEDKTYVAVCDDDPVVGEYIAAAIRGFHGSWQSCYFSTSEELIQTVRSGKAFDVVLMDIEWDGEERGIKASQQLEELAPRTGLIYITGYTEKYVQDVFLTSSNLKGFLMKPIDPEYLRKSLYKVLSEQREHKPRRLSFLQNREYYSIPYNDIYYLESVGHRIYINLKESSYICYGRLNDMENEAPRFFLRCHQSYLVNMDWVYCIQAKTKCFVMKNERRIPISKQNYRASREAYLAYKMDECLGNGMK